MGVTEESGAAYGAMVWTGLAVVVGLWWSMAQLDLVAFDWAWTVPLAVLALAVSLLLSWKAS